MEDYGSEELDFTAALGAALERVLAEARSDEEEAQRAHRLLARLVAGDTLAVVVAPVESAAVTAASALGAQIFRVRRPSHAAETLPPPPESNGGLPPALRCTADGAWFVRADGTRACLRRRGTLRRLLKVLVEQRLARPGVPIPRDDLFAAAWPTERCTPASAANRLYFAIASVRSLGLRPWLLHLESGYLLDPEVPLEVETPRTLLAAGDRGIR